MQGEILFPFSTQIFFSFRCNKVIRKKPEEGFQYKRFRIPFFFRSEHRTLKTEHFFLTLVPIRHLSQYVRENASVAKVLKFHVGVQSNKCFKRTGIVFSDCRNGDSATGL